jgi:hypothetical protein
VDELIDMRGIKNEQADYPKIKRILARNSKNLTTAEKKELLNVLFFDEE